MFAPWKLTWISSGLDLSPSFFESPLLLLSVSGPLSLSSSFEDPVGSLSDFPAVFAFEASGDVFLSESAFSAGDLVDLESVASAWSFLAASWARTSGAGASSDRASQQARSCRAPPLVLRCFFGGFIRFFGFPGFFGCSWFFGLFCFFGQETLAAETGKNHQLLFFRLAVAFEFDEHAVRADFEQFDGAKIVALFYQAGLAFGRPEHGGIASDSEQGHGHWPHDLTEYLGLNDTIDAILNFRRQLGDIAWAARATGTSRRTLFANVFGVFSSGHIGPVRRGIC